MKQIKTVKRIKLTLTTETVRALNLLTTEQLTLVHGGAMHTTFSCGVNLCTTH
jgi:hypothetical protein